MVQQLQSAKIICKGGLDAGNNFLELSDTGPGFATKFVNYEWALEGGYRKINGYKPLVADFTTVDDENAEGKILLTCIYKEMVIVARKQKGSLTYKFYWTDVGFSSWTVFSTPTLTLSSVGVNKIRFAKFNFNGTDKIMFVDGVNKPVIFNGSLWSNPSGDQLGDLRPAYITVFKNHIFVSGDLTNPNLVIHSEPLNEASWNSGGTTGGGAGQITAGFKVLQIQPYRDANYILGELNIKRVIVSGTDFVIEDVATDIGCVASDSVVEINGDILFLSQDGFRPISSTERIGDIELASVSKKIQPILRDYIRYYEMEDLTSVVIRGKSQVRFFFNNSDATPNQNKGIVGCVYQTGNEEGWFWGELSGLRTSSATSGYLRGREVVIHGDFDGGVYQQEIGGSFNGSDIPTVYSTPHLDFGDTQTRKTMRKLNIFIRPEGTVEMAVGLNYDWKIPDTLDPETYYVLNRGAFEYYGTAVYSQSNYAGNVSPVMKLDIEGSGFAVQTTFATNDQLGSFTIQGLIYEFSVDGKD